MNKKNNSTLIAGIITIALISTVVIFSFLTREKSNEKDSPLEVEEKKIGEMNFDLTFINPKEVSDAIRKEDFLIVDARTNQEFYENHIESSINIPLEELKNRISSLDKDKTIILVEKEETLNGKKIADELKKQNFKLNYLTGGLFNYLGTGYGLISHGDVTSAQDRAKVSLIDLATLGKKLQAGERLIYLDVRTKTDFNKDHFENSINIPLEDLEKNKKDIPTGKLLIIDENPIRSFQAAVRLDDMSILTTYYLTDKYSELKAAIKNKTLLQ